MRKVLIGIMTAALSFGSLARDLTDNEKSVVESVVKEDMKNPSSAHFYHNNLSDTGKGNIYCGYVSSDESHAGKLLFSVFLAKNDSGEDKALPLGKDLGSGEALDQDVISAMCAGAGYNTKVKKVIAKDVNKTRAKNGLPPLDKSQIIN